MAKLAVINREDKRRKTVKKFAAKRTVLKAIINDVKQSDEERMDARLKLLIPTTAKAGTYTGTLTFTVA